MSELSLPREVNYGAPMPALPDGAVSTLMSVQSTNGISFSSGQVIQFDLPSQAGLYIIPSSVFIRYRYTITNTATATAPVVVRKPAYTLITRLEEFIGSQPVSSVYAYNLAANSFIDQNFSLADVVGQYAGFGFSANPTDYTDLDGQSGNGSGTNGGVYTGYVAAPLVCSALAGMSHYYPTSLTAPWRIQLTVAPLSEVVSVVANVSSIAIVQPELCFQVIQLGSAVDAMVTQMAPTLKIKTRAWAVASQSIASGTSGFQTLPFNHRYESLSSIFLHSCSTSTTKSLNAQWGDSFNPMGTAGTNGSVQFQIGQAMYPQLPLNNATGGVTAVLQYLRQCNSGSITDQRNTMAIQLPNWTQYSGDATASTTNAPAKFVVGIPLEKVVPASPYALTSLLSGVSATQSPINVLLNIGSSLNTQFNFFLVAEYDEIIEIMPAMKQVNIVC
jgi:hypothetical protein